MRTAVVRDRSRTDVRGWHLPSVRDISVVLASGKVTPALVTEATIGTAYREASPIGIRHPRNGSPPAAPVADAETHLRGFRLPVRQNCGSINKSAAAPDYHGIPIGSGGRKLKRVSCWVDDRRGA